MKRLITYFMLFFNKNKKKYVISPKEVVEKPSKVNKFEETLKKIEVGDIIWAKRYKSKEEKNRIEEGHREGPFLVLEKLDSGFLCCSGSSTERKNSKLNFELKQEKYNLSKNTYFNPLNLIVIDEKTYVKFLDKLQNKDKHNLYKKLKELNVNYYYENNQKKYFEYPLQIGDVINHKGSNYIILDIKENDLYCIPLGERIIETLDVNKIDYSNIVCINSNIKYKCVKTVSNNMILAILKRQKEYVENIKNANTPQRGSVVKINNKYYYIYGEEGLKWLLFEISTSPQNDYEKIIIGKQKYYTDFNNDIKIDKKEIQEAIVLATKEKIEEIKNSRKNYKKQNQVKNVQQESFIVGDIVESLYQKDDKFLIINISNDIYECISIKKLLYKKVIDKIFLKKEELQELSEKGIREIKWLLNNEDFKFALKLHGIRKPNKIK